ncbi:MAG TPA: LysR family transcriptional regulator [Burkholderiaceae bacterium]|nr:LysR family transcriptional regulator [Burkholderiaceae bacterium]
MSGVQQFFAFAQTARRGSFSEAARDLGSSPSTVAKSVARLEAGLGVKLFHRTTRRVSLTADGERLFRRCERVLAEVEDLQAEAAGARAAPSGTLRIDMPITYGRRIVMPLLAQFALQHPTLELDVRLQDSFSDLVRDGLDIAIRASVLRDSTLIARRIDWQQLIVVASPQYLRERGTPRRVEDLPRHSLIAFRQPTSGRTRPWQLRTGQRQIELNPEPRTLINDGEGMVAAAVAGLGLTQVPDYMAGDELARGALVEVMVSHRPAAMPISALMPSSRLMPPRVRLLLEALQGLRKRHA